MRGERERLAAFSWKEGAIGKNGNGLQFSHNLRATARPNVSVPRLPWKSRGVPQKGRERERDGSAGGGRDEEEKEASYILYDSVIAFPRTNIALAERAQENVGVNRSSPFYSPRPSVRSFFHPLLPLSLPLFVLPFSSSSSCVPPRTFLLLVYSYRVIESVRNFSDGEN